MWTEPYLRLASHTYSSDVKDVFAHLTNNSIQKYGADYDGNMWGFTDYCDNILGPELEKEQRAQPNLKNYFLRQMSAIIVAAVQAVEENICSFKGSFELLGFDFLIDQSLKVWLLEVNSTPTLQYSTDLVHRLVDDAAEGWVDILMR